MISKGQCFLGVVAMLVAGAVCADTLTTTSGDVINGTIQGIHGGKVIIETAFAGTLKIDRALVSKMDYTPQGEIFARTNPTLQDKSAVTVSRDAEGNLILIPEGDKAKALALSDVSTIWGAHENDPDFPPIKRWAFSASLGFSGTSGSSSTVSMSAYVDAVRTGESTTFKTYASMNKTRSESETTAERYIAGLDFEHRPTAILSWYVRDEAQHNRFSDYKLRNVLGAGLGFYVWNTKTEGRVSMLRFRTGLAHTYTEHYAHKLGDPTSRVTDSDVALDLGILFHYDFVCGVSWNTEITYTPLIDDLEDGTLVHESKLSYLMTELGVVNEHLSDIALEAGMRNEYQTRPSPGTNHSDTSWYVRLKKTW